MYGRRGILNGKKNRRTMKALIINDESFFGKGI
jgi:hypothetical protein